MSDFVPFPVNVKFGDRLEAMVLNGESYDVPIGALTVFQIVVTVDDVPAAVTSSSWDVQGEQIDGGSVVQTPEEGTGLVQVNPVIPGGYGGDPSCMATAWIQEGTFAITVSGTFLYEEVSNPFEAAGTVTVHAPQFDLTGSDPEVSQPTFDNDQLTTQFGTTTVQYECDAVTSGGQIGFLQVISGLRLRGAIIGIPTESMGSLQHFVDMSNDALFYSSEQAQQASDIQTNDQPSLTCDGEPDYTWYRVGDLNDSEKFSMYLAYKAPITGAVVESYIVVNAVCNWSWAMVGVYENDTWGPDSDATEWSCNGWSQQEWSLPLWTDNSVAVRNWQPYIPS